MKGNKGNRRLSNKRKYAEAKAVLFARMDTAQEIVETRIESSRDPRQLRYVAGNLRAIARGMELRAELLMSAPRKAPTLTKAERRYCRLEAIKPADFLQRKIAMQK